MPNSQLDILRRQAEAAVHTAAARSAAELRRETSLVTQVSRLAGSRPEAPVAPPRAVVPPEGGRRSPVQPVREAEGYRRRLVLRGIAVVLLLAAAVVGLEWLSRLGLFGR